MAEVQINLSGDSAKVGQDAHYDSPAQPSFDVTGLLKEGSKSSGFSDKGAGSGSVAASENSDSAWASIKKDAQGAIGRVEDIAAPVFSDIYHTLSTRPSYEVDECAADTEMALLLPAGLPAALMGGKWGAEAGFSVGGPTGLFAGGAIGALVGLTTEMGVSSYAGLKLCGAAESERPIES